MTRAADPCVCLQVIIFQPERCFRFNHVSQNERVRSTSLPRAAARRLRVEVTRRRRQQARAQAVRGNR
jgi:hypothetical protein